MEQKEREYVAGYLTCMVKTAIESGGLASTLLGTALGAGIGGAGGYFGTQNSAEENPKEVAKRRHKNMMLGLLGGGATGAIAGFVPGQIDRWKSEVNPTKSWPTWLWEQSTGPLAGAGFGSWLGARAGKKYVDAPKAIAERKQLLSDFLEQTAGATRAHSGPVTNPEGLTMKKLYTLMGLNPQKFETRAPMPATPPGGKPGRPPPASERWIPTDRQDILYTEALRKLKKGLKPGANPKHVEAVRQLEEMATKAKATPRGSLGQEVLDAARKAKGSAKGKYGVLGGLSGAALSYLIPYLMGGNQ